ncbi:hypothetical protein [Aliifodinibius sp. S!AR15-10]|nr:hypothetical protein [Aliifodinibius sp. S!AR15-10]
MSSRGAAGTRDAAIPEWERSIDLRVCAKHAKYGLERESKSY